MKGYLSLHTLSFFPLGILGKPSLAHALPLFKHLKDAPERREGNHAEDDAAIEIGDKEGEGTGDDAGNEERPPAAHAEIILALDDKGMEETYDEEGHETCDDTCE